MGILSIRVIGVVLLIVLFSGIMVSADVLGRRMLGAGGGGGLRGSGRGTGVNVDHVASIGNERGGGYLGGEGIGSGGGRH